MLSRADLQRWQNVLPHLMHGRRSRACGAEDPEREAKMRVTRAPSDTGLMALVIGSKYGVVAEDRARGAPLRDHAASSQASGIEGGYITTFCGGGFESSRSMYRAIELLGLLDLLSLLVEFVRLAAGDRVVVVGDGELRIELLRFLILGDRGREIVVEEVQIADVHVRAG